MFWYHASCPIQEIEGRVVLRRRPDRFDFPALGKNLQLPQRQLSSTETFPHFGSHKIQLWVQMSSKFYDEDGIRTHACRAHWISSPTP